MIFSFFLTLVGFFLGGLFPTVAPSLAGGRRVVFILVLLRVCDRRLPPSCGLLRLGFLFGLFVDAFKVGS